MKQLNTNNGKYFVQDYLPQNKDEFLENENYKTLTIIIFFPFKGRGSYFQMSYLLSF